MRRVTSIRSESLKAAGARRSELSSTSPTSALLREGRRPEPEKMTSSMPEARMFLNEFSPITQRSASTRFDLPQPFGPTTPVSPGSILNSAASQKLLKPVRRKRSNFIRRDPSARAAPFAAVSSRSPRRESFFARRRHGLAAITESRNQSGAMKNLCESGGLRRCGPVKGAALCERSTFRPLCDKSRASTQNSAPKRSARVLSHPRRHGRS